MTFLQELASWNPFARSHQVQKVPEVGSAAPLTPNLTVPRADGKPIVIIFLRHCGCPFAEKTFKVVRKVAQETPNVHFIAVSHSDQSATNRWLEAVGGAGTIEVVVDAEREAYGAYGLGLSSFWHTLNPASLSAVSSLGKSENIQIRPTESGSRWQTAGMFGVGSDSKIKYAHVAQSAEDLGDIEGACKAVQQ